MFRVAAVATCLTLEWAKGQLEIPMGSLSPSIVEKKASQSLPAFEEGAVTAPPQPVKGCKSFKRPSLARPACRLTACRLNGMPM